MRHPWVHGHHTSSALGCLWLHALVHRWVLAPPGFGTTKPPGLKDKPRFFNKFGNFGVRWSGRFGVPRAACERRWHVALPHPQHF